MFNVLPHWVTLRKMNLNANGNKNMFNVLPHWVRKIYLNANGNKNMFNVTPLEDN